jgi:1,2-diacylglycerol 3-beta-galactosyltransferase
MRNSDLLITKAGPGTVYEAVACQLPVVIISHIPGQEEGNADHFVKMGVAAVSSSPGDTVQLIRGFIANRAALANMRNPSLAQRTCQAADRIGRAVVEIAEADAVSSVGWPADSPAYDTRD